MTNHGESTGSFGNDDIIGRDGHIHPDRGHDESRLTPAGPAHPLAAGDPAVHQVTLRTPAELADALPYVLGYRPEDSIVMVALHDRAGRGRFGGRARLGIPASEEDWPSAARQLAHGLVRGGERRGARPEQIVVYLCHEPEQGETGRQVMDRLRPLAHRLRVECGALDVPVIEALCISGGRFWSYCCDQKTCCPPEGLPMGLPGTSVLAAAATYAGLQVRGTLRELRARLQPWETPAALRQEAALDAAGMKLVPRILDEAGRASVARETLDLARRVMRRLAEAPSVPGAFAADHRDDDLLAHDEAAALVLGLQDRATRDRAAEWMEGDEAGPALRLWRALARRCVGPYGEHAAAPLTLAGWVAWSTGDELEAREALAMALGADPGYLFARLLHQACNEGLDPESLRRCLRAERGDREHTRTGPAAGPDPAASGPADLGHAVPSSTGPGLGDLGPAGPGSGDSGPADPGPAAPARSGGVGSVQPGSVHDVSPTAPAAPSDIDGARQPDPSPAARHPHRADHVPAAVDGSPARDAAREPRRTGATRSRATRDLHPRGTRVPRPRTPAAGAGATRPGPTGPDTARADGTRPRRTSAKDALRRRRSCPSTDPRPETDRTEGDA
ncbi:DUF4192 family protein [Streptomyces sp. NPDC093094]|uniref:DUF4192 domain-containing protein n=1 Tax=Streptomyces sp. NPDC093094 TaxID=3366026 RepID=UPI00381F3412